MNKSILIFFLIGIASSIPQICKQVKYSLPKHIDSSVEGELANTKACFVYLIENEQYQSIDKLEQSLNDQEQAIMEQLLAHQIIRLKSIEQLVIQTKTTCEPVLKWAQNQTHIFVAAKLSHRWDSPPCLKSIKEKYQLNSSILTFQNVCLVSNAQIKFHFANKLYNKAKQDLEVKKDGVGTYSLTFQKEQQQIWPYLFQDQQKIATWQQLMDRNGTYRVQYENLLKKIDAERLASSKSQN